MKVFITGNGNLSFENFIKHYVPHIEDCLKQDADFILGDFRGADVLSLEYLKNKTKKVTIYKKHNYKVDRFKTFVDDWIIVEGILNDTKRDNIMLEQCSHIIGVDFNSDNVRKSGTLKNIEKAIELNKIYLNGRIN